MGLEDDFLKNDLDDEKTIEYIKNYLPDVILFIVQGEMEYTETLGEE